MWYTPSLPRVKTKYHRKFVQISLADIYNDSSFSFQEQKPELLALLEEYIDFDSCISDDFFRAFYNRFGRKHTYHLDTVNVLIHIRIRIFDYIPVFLEIQNIGNAYTMSE